MIQKKGMCKKCTLLHAVPAAVCKKSLLTRRQLEIRANRYSFVDSLEQLRSELLKCRECKGLFGFEPRPISMGNSCAKIMQVSQAPSVHVHNTGRSFNDISGRRLRGEWYKISDETFYDPNVFYITSVGHCYPGKSKNKGDNPPPKICAQKWLKREFDNMATQDRIINSS